MNNLKKMIFDFNQLPESSSTWFKFIKPRVTAPDGKIIQQGDTLSGTLTGVRKNVVTKEGIAAQTIFDILVAKGTELIIDGVKIITQKDTIYMYGDRKVPFLAQMDRISLGQYVKLEFIEFRDVHQLQPAKIIQPFSHPKYVNEEWLKDNETRLQREEELNKLTAPAAPVGDMSMSMETNIDTTDINAEIEIDEEAIPFVTEDEVRDRLMTINMLSIQKLGVTDPNIMKIEIKKVTGLDFTDLNLNKIINALKLLPNK